MRDEHQEYREAGATIAVVVHDFSEAVADYWGKERLPYIGIPDPEGTVGNLYQQGWKLLRLGRMPALFVIDSQRRLVAEHRGRSMSDIPENSDVLALLRR